MSDYIELESNVISERPIRRTTTYPNPPHISGIVISNLKIGQVAEARPNDSYTYLNDVIVNGELLAKKGDKWWKVYKANVTSLSEEGWIAEVHKGLRRLNARLVSDTPISNPHVVEVYIDKVQVFRKELD
jgi:hypothetical protein